MSAFIDEHRGRFGVEPICRVVDVSASAYSQRAGGERSVGPWRTSGCSASSASCTRPTTTPTVSANVEGAGADRRTVGRDRVKRLMRTHAIQGAKRRGKPWRTTTPDPAAHRPPDLVRRNFNAQLPDQLWVADFTYLRCWEGVVFFSFVLDVFSRRVVGWQFASHMRTDLVLDALRMALTRRAAGADVGLVHHSDAGSPIHQLRVHPGPRRPRRARIGRVGRRRLRQRAGRELRRQLQDRLIADRVWRTRTQLELAIVEYVAWFNHARLHEASATCRQPSSSTYTTERSHRSLDEQQIKTYNPVSAGPGLAQGRPR